MHQYKTVAHILLILSIFNLVFAVPIPVARQIDDEHDDAIVPVVVRNVAATSNSKERREDPNGTPLHSSPPPPDGSAPSLLPPPPDGSTPPHSSPPLPNGSPSDGPTPLRESPPPPPGGSAALAVSPAPGNTASLPAVPASDQPKGSWKKYLPGHGGRMVIIDTAMLAVVGTLLWEIYHGNNTQSRRTIGPDRYVSNPSHTSPADA
jgi:hypothetical protein